MKFSLVLEILINLYAIKQRIRTYFPNITFILMLIPMFLIISSSVYPAIISSVQNKEMLIITEAVAQLKEDNVDTSSHHSTLPISSSYIAPSSPTPIDPTSTATLATSTQSFETPIIAEDHGEDLITATAINAGGLVHVLWADNTPGNSDIFYKRDGADFDPTTINLSNNDGDSSSPAIAVSGNNVHVVWRDNILGNNDIFYKRSTDGGATFGPTINLSDNDGSSQAPSIAVSGNIVHVVWSDDTPGNFDIFYRRSTDGGASFVEPTKNLSSNPRGSGAPAIAVSGNNVHVVWSQDILGPGFGREDILYRRSVDGGSTFPNIIKDLSNNDGFSEVPAIAAIDNSVHVVWHDSAPGNVDIFYRRSTDGGASFTEPIKNLSDNPGRSLRPAIAVTRNSVHVVWDDGNGILEILYRRSIDRGSTFSNTIQNLSMNSGFSFEPAIAAISNNVYVVWTVEDILYITSANGGFSFPAILTNLSTNAGSSRFPAIAIS